MVYLKKMQLKKDSLSDRVMQQLRKVIIERKLVPGDRLPSEQELADHFQVGRHTVREALKKMEVMGMIRSQVGQGNFITQINIEPILDLMIDQLILSPCENSQLLELRYALEIKTSYLSAIRRSENDLQDLQQILNRMENVSNDLDQLVTQAIQFHIAIAKAAHNELFTMLLGTVLTLFSAKEKELLSDQNRASQMFAIHSTIYNTVKNGDSLEAQRQMQQYMEVISQAITK